MRRLRTHPGAILLHEFMEPLGLNAAMLAGRIGVPVTRISRIVGKRRRVTADTALRLSRFFQTSPEFWTGAQAGYDLSRASSVTDFSVIRPLKMGQRW